MSNFLAIATATAALQASLREAVEQDVSGAQVVTRRPNSLIDQQVPTVNIYPYAVTPNAAWRNADLPTRRANGQILQRPCAALDLHYLLSFYGDEDAMVPQRLAGSVVRTLHVRPVLDRARIAAVIASRTFLNGGEGGTLPRADLDQQVEQVKFTPIMLSLEELSKLWSVFFQTPHTLSVAYQASLVFIEADAPLPTPLPVRGRNVYVVPFRQPVITAVEAEGGTGQPIVAQSTLRIRGSQLRGQNTLVRVDALEPQSPVSVSGTAVLLPLSALPTALRAGVHRVQVVHQILMGTPATPHLGVESNVAAFVLHPTITQVSQTGTETLTVEISPQVTADQRVVLLLNSADPTVEPVQAFSIIANPFTELTAPVEFDVSGVAAGNYLARVQVDGATSSLEVDADEDSLTFNRFIAPQVTIA
jgi:hypothetical protein